MKIYYMGLEPYEGRYTLQLTDWTENVFKKRKIDYEIVEPKRRKTIKKSYADNFVN